MRTSKTCHLSRTALVLASLLTCTTSQAWVAHGGGGYYHGGGDYHGGYYHNNYYNGYYHGGWGGPAVVVGVPGGYYAPAYVPYCTMVQQCYPNGTCVQRQVCD